MKFGFKRIVFRNILKLLPPIYELLSSSFSKGNSESEWEEAREREPRRDRMCVEFVALPEEISVAQAECSRGDCERESLALV